MIPARRSRKYALYLENIAYANLHLEPLERLFLKKNNNDEKILIIKR